MCIIINFSMAIFKQSFLFSLTVMEEYQREIAGVDSALFLDWAKRFFAKLKSYIGVLNTCF